MGSAAADVGAQGTLNREPAAPKCAGVQLACMHHLNDSEH